MTSNKGDEAKYTLTLQFQGDEEHIKLGKKFQNSMFVKQRSSKDDLAKAKNEGQLVQQMKTPYNLDFVNKRDNSKVNKNKESIIENVRLLITSETIFEDEAVGISDKRLANQDFVEIDQDAKNQIMLGIDPDDEARKDMPEHRKESLREIQEAVKHDIKDTLDLSYYHLGNEGL